MMDLLHDQVRGLAVAESPPCNMSLQDQRPPAAFAPDNVVLEICDYGNTLTGEGCDDSYVDSVFASSPRSSTIPSDPRQSISDLEKSSKSAKESPRLILHSDGGAAVCRICHSSEKSCPFSNGEPLITPCHCRGSTGLFHRTCLERWLSTSNKDKCEICKYQYSIEREPKNLKEFLSKPGSKSIRRHIISDAVCWLLLTPIAIVGTWLCISGAVARAATADKPESFDRLQVPTLLGLAVFLVMTYMVWSVICVRYHLRVWRRWRLRNYKIRVLDTQEAKKRRVSSNGSDANNDDGFHLRAPRTPVGRLSPRLVGAAQSVDSARTYFSTPWASLHPTSPIGSYSMPYGYPIRVHGLSTIFEPRSAAAMQDIPL